MCGIIGYIGKRQASEVVLNGLKLLEYRGYDSCGMASIVPVKKALSIRKLPLKVAELEKLLKKKPLLGQVAIGHVRWATHGAPNQINAHPHCDAKSEIAVVHNGIIENYQELKKELIKQGHHFKSSTDTEIIPYLIARNYKDKDLLEAVIKTVNILEGSFAICVMSSREPGKIIGARKNSPLVVGIGREENFLASDIPAFLKYTKDVMYLNEEEIAVLTKDEVLLYDFSGKKIERKSTLVKWDFEQAQKKGFSHFMLKEINEQPEILQNMFHQRLKNNQVFFEEMVLKEDFLREIENITIVACGTAFHAGLVGKYMIESSCGINVNVAYSSELRYSRFIPKKNAILVAISQSGETADTLAAVKRIKQEGVKVLSICNVLGSSLARESDAVIYTHAGPEISVASTKAYTAQIATLALFMLYLAQIKNITLKPSRDILLKKLLVIPQLLSEILKNQNSILRLAKRHSHFGSFLYLGRNINYPSALEGALKLKEISYIPAEGYAAGEMKHGPIALIDEYRAVVCVATKSFVYEKMISNIQEINARKAKIIIISNEINEVLKSFTKEIISIPQTEEIFSPLLVALPLQILAYGIAVKRGCDVDQPRNLAKSVTVE
ncbi:MAG: glutamine--fructose-6-phosphate transaminase (isomerizing) [Candidatus Gygaella obscura]|nr:glutamine--fructose-6-phosphate transaminase (isomerizing) [Candidatus Gygaella obscura]